MIAVTLMALAGSWHTSFAQTPTSHPALTRLDDVSNEMLFTIYVECMDTDCDTVLDEINRRSDDMFDLMLAIVIDGQIAESAQARGTSASLRYATIESAAGILPLPAGPPSSARATFEALDRDQYHYASVTSAAHALAHIGNPAAIDALETARERALVDERPDVAAKIQSRIDVLETREAADSAGLPRTWAALLLVAFIAGALLLLIAAARHGGDGPGPAITEVAEVKVDPPGGTEVGGQQPHAPTTRETGTIHEGEYEVDIDGIRVPKRLYQLLSRMLPFLRTD